MLARIRFALSQCTQYYRWGLWNIGRIGVGYWKHILVVGWFGSGRSWNVFDRVFPGSLFTLRYLWEFWVFCLRNKVWQGKLCVQEINVYFFPQGVMYTSEDGRCPHGLSRAFWYMFFDKTITSMTWFFWPMKLLLKGLLGWRYLDSDMNWRDKRGKISLECTSWYFWSVILIFFGVSSLLINIFCDISI